MIKNSKPFKTHLGEEAFYNFINSMIGESKYCSDVVKTLFNKELGMTKEYNENFKNTSKSWIFDNNCVDNDVKVRDNCHITGKYRGSVHRYCMINLELNHKILVIFHSLKKYDSYFIMQELGTFSLKINVIPNGLKIYTSFTVNNKFNFINSFQSSSSDSLRDNFKYLS